MKSFLHLSHRDTNLLFLQGKILPLLQLHNLPLLLKKSMNLLKSNMRKNSIKMLYMNIHLHIKKQISHSSR